MSATIRTIAVVGSTGKQGSGVVSALLSSTPFTVRAVTRNPSSDTAKALLTKHDDAVKDGRLEVVAGDLADEESLEKAFQGVERLFAAWMSYGDELAEGKRLVNAAKAAGIAHFVYSTLPSISKASDGTLTKCRTFDAKPEVAANAKEQLPAVTEVVPGGFFANLHTPLYTTRTDDGTVIFRCPIKATSTIEWLDESYDVGVFAAAIFNKGVASTAGKLYPIMGPPLTMPELAGEYEAATGEKTLVRPLPLDEALGMLPYPQVVRDMLGDMYKYIDMEDPSKRMYGTTDPAEAKSYEELGVRASTFREWIERTGFRAAGETSGWKRGVAIGRRRT
ncbi:hypothetical protein JCM8097_007439 [Rhodosporidiobolus ruineniae]